MMLVNSVIHLQIIYLVRSWIAPEGVKCCSLSPLLLRTMHHIAVVKKPAAQVGVFCQQAAASLH